VQRQIGASGAAGHGIGDPGGRVISFTICTIDGNIQASQEMRGLQCADALRNWTQGIQHQAAALNATSMARSASKQLVVCVGNDGYPASLEKRKLYVMLPDPAAEKHGLLRVIDESGKDYLYPKSFFRSVALPQSVKKAVLSAP
jgi:hypothetical protein